MSIPKDSEKILERQVFIDDFDSFRANNFKQNLPANELAAFDAVSAVSGPPLNNMGGYLPLPPHLLPHSEKSEESVVKQKTKVDWLAFTTARDLDPIKAGIQVLWPHAVFSARSTGLKGYSCSIAIFVDEVQYGVIGHHGENKAGRNYISLTGVACSTLSDEQVIFAYEVLKLLEARLSRLDIALDFYNGERTWDHALWSYEGTKGFCSLGGGRKPPYKTITGQDGFGNNSGRTLYVGTRGETEKFVRVYEKGLEVFSKLPKDLRDASHERSQAKDMVFSVEDAVYADKWLRIEIEFSRQKKDLPLEMLIDRDQYFAGAYPYCADCLGLVDGLRPVSLKTELDVDLIKLIGHGQKAYGSLVFTLKELGFTDSEVVQVLSSGKLSSKLVRSGVYARIKARQAELMAEEELRRSLDPDFDIPDFGPPPVLHISPA